MDLDDDGDDNNVRADNRDDNAVRAEEGDNVVRAVEGDDNIVPADEGDDNIRDTKSANDKEEDDPDDEEVAIGDIQWNYGYKPIPTVDELWPNETPEDNARWYQELHSRPATPPGPIGNKSSKPKSKICAEEKFCKLCFHEGESMSVVTSHHNLDITCPTMTDEEKETMYGPDWIPKMFGYT